MADLQARTAAYTTVSFDWIATNVAGPLAKYLAYLCLG